MKGDKGMFYFGNERPLTAEEVKRMKDDYGNGGDECSPFDGFCLCLTAEMLRGQVAATRETLESLITYCEQYADFRNGNSFNGIDEGAAASQKYINEQIKPALQGGVDYHNPSDTAEIERLRKFIEGVQFDRDIEAARNRALTRDKDEFMRMEQALNKACVIMAEYLDCPADVLSESKDDINVICDCEKRCDTNILPKCRELLLVGGAKDETNKA